VSDVRRTGVGLTHGVDVADDIGVTITVGIGLSETIQREHIFTMLANTTSNVDRENVIYLTECCSSVGHVIAACFMRIQRLTA
jgi:hypothetical protein